MKTGNVSFADIWQVSVSNCHVVVSNLVAYFIRLEEEAYFTGKLMVTPVLRLLFFLDKASPWSWSHTGRKRLHMGYTLR